MSSSSPWRPHDSSPARAFRRSGSRNPASPQRPVVDSPSRQLAQELQLLHIDLDRKLQNDLDARVAEEKRRHDELIAQSHAYHERIRQSAERQCELSALEAERERKQKEAEEVAALEKARQTRVAREEEERRKEKDRLQKELDDRTKRETEERELQESRARVEEQKQEGEEQKRKALEDARQKAKDSADAARAKRVITENADPAPSPATAPASLGATGPAKPTVPTGSTPQASTTLPKQKPVVNGNSGSRTALSGAAAEREQLHKRYLELHKSLKQMREYVVTESKKLPALKSKIGDWRREITKCMGQLTTDKNKNKTPMGQIQNVLIESLKYSQPSIDLAPYLISYAPPSTPLQMSGPFVYLYNIFTKAIVRQFISESSGGHKQADSVGVIAVALIANTNFKVGGTIPLIDILLAKFHVTCPILWGIYGPHNSVAGRERIGWWKEDGQWVPEQRHIERITGLASGFSALSLRDFSKSKNENPFPNTNYWHAMAVIVNTPAQKITPTHFIALKGLIDGYVQRFVGFYGYAAIALLRTAMVDFPARAKSTGDKSLSQAADTIVVLKEVLKRDLKLTLD